MILDLKQLFEVVGSRLNVDEQLQWQEYDLFDRKPFATPLTVVGVIENRAEVVCMNLTVSFTLLLSCDRCLEEYEQSFVFAMEHVLVTEAATEHDEYIVIPDRQLNVDEVVESCILLNLPSKLLCQEDCKGLCAICGGNKNVHDCDCKEKLGDPRFGMLDQLLK